MSSEPSRTSSASAWSAEAGSRDPEWHRHEAQPGLRLLIAVPFGPRFDSLHGGRVTAQLLERLTESNRVGVVYLRRPGAPPMDPELASRCELVHEVARPEPLIGRLWRNRINVLAGPIVGLPSSVSAGFSIPFLRAVRAAADKLSPDLIQLEHDAVAYCAPWLRGHAGARLLVCHDPGLRASEHLAAVTSGRQRWAHRIDARVWRRYWRTTLSTLNATIVFTEEDARLLRTVVPGIRVATIPLGIDLPDAPLSPTGSGNTVVFVGGYGHLPNADAALLLERSIMPMARAAVPELELLLVGDQPTEEMRDAAGPLDTITGFVESVDPFVDRAAVVAVPIRIGGGMRVKLLEALAAGKAIVASPLAAAGLSLTDGEQLLLAHDDRQFAESIVRLIRDSGMRRRLGDEARRWAEQNLSWDSRVRDYEHLYRSLAAGAEQAPTAQIV